MGNIRLFFSESLSLNLTAKLDKSQSHYVNKVMRIKVKKLFLYLIVVGSGKQKLKKLPKELLNLL